MPDSLKIEHARFVLTMDPQRRIIADGAVLVREGRIVRAGKTAELAGEPADQVIDAAEMVVTPGFVNGHMHISYAHATRGIFPDSLGERYLPNVFRLSQVMTPEEEYHTSLLALTELVRTGTTTIVDPGSTRFVDACLPAYAASGCRVITGVHVTDRPNPINLPVYRTDEALKLLEDSLRWDGALGGQVRAWAMPFGPGFCSVELLRAAKDLADRAGTRLTLHYTIRDEQRVTSGPSPSERLEEAGILGPNVVLAHALGLDGRDVAAIARTGATVIAVPTAAIKGGSGMTATGRLPELLAAGVACGLGTDAANNSNLVETQRAMYLIAVLYKDGRRDVQQMPAETALELATIGGARALGLEAEIGSIEPGKQADLVLFDTRRAEWRTLFNPVNSLVYSADGRSVDTVLIGGRVMVQGGRALFVDEWDLIQRVQGIGAAMLERAGLSFPPRWPVE